MKALIFGTGKIGSAVAWDLARNADVESVGIVDVCEQALQQAQERINSPKVHTHRLDVTDTRAAAALLRKYDVGVITLPTRKTSYKAVEAAIEAGISCVDILEEYHRRPDTEEDEELERPDGMSHTEYGEWLHQRAVENGVTILDGLGFAPGLSNVTVGEGIRKLDEAETAVARVGGIPSKETARRHPLDYVITWSFSHVLREYTIKTKIIKNGVPTTVNALDEHETFSFNDFGKDAKLEAFITPGMPSFVHTRANLMYFAEKTVRWPGHWRKIQALKECGLLSLELEDFFIPRLFLSKVLTPKLLPQDGDTDVCVMYNTITGLKNGEPASIEYFMWAEADPENDLSAMARVTGFTAAAGAVLLAKGKILPKGLVAPEDAFVGESYNILMQELEKRGLDIKARFNGKEIPNVAD